MTTPIKPRVVVEWDVPYLPYFSHDALVNDWPPGWMPDEESWGRDSVMASTLAAQSREERVKVGELGTIVGLSNKSDARLRDVNNRPGWAK